MRGSRFSGNNGDSENIPITSLPMAPSRNLHFEVIMTVRVDLGPHIETVRFCSRSSNAALSLTGRDEKISAAPVKPVEVLDMRGFGFNLNIFITSFPRAMKCRFRRDFEGKVIEYDVSEDCVAAILIVVYGRQKGRSMRGWGCRKGAGMGLKDEGDRRVRTSKGSLLRVGGNGLEK